MARVLFLASTTGALLGAVSGWAMAAQGNSMVLFVALIAAYGAFIGLAGGVMTGVILSLLTRAFGWPSRRSWVRFAFFSALLGSAMSYAVFLLRQTEYSPSIMIGVATLVVGGALAFVLQGRRQEVGKTLRPKAGVSSFTIIYITAVGIIAVFAVLSVALLAVLRMSDAANPIQALSLLPQDSRFEILLRLGYVALFAAGVVAYQVYSLKGGSEIWRGPSSNWHRHHAALCSFGWVAIHTFWVMGAVDEVGRLVAPGAPAGPASSFAWWLAISGWLALCAVMISIFTRIGLVVKRKRSQDHSEWQQGSLDTS